MDHAYKWNLSSLKGERGYFDLDLAEEKGLETDFASSALPHRFAAPEYVQKLKERFDSGKIPTPEMKALLSWMSGSRLIHFALYCKSSDFNKADRAEVMFFGMALLLQFEICESAADAIRIHGFGSLYEFFFQSGISRPWKLGTFYLEIFFAIVKTLFRGNHKEVSMLDVLAASRKANPY